MIATSRLLFATRMVKIRLGITVQGVTCEIGLKSVAPPGVEVPILSKLFIAISLCFLLGCCVALPGHGQQSYDQLQIRSPRLVALEKQLKSGDVAALDSFWREVKQQGTPSGGTHFRR
jgi:hypothetical protein